MVKEHCYTLIKEYNHNVQKLGLGILKTCINNLESIISLHLSITANIFRTTANRPFLPSITLFSQIFDAYPLMNIQKWLINIIDLDFDAKIYVKPLLKGCFCMLSPKNTKFLVECYATLHPALSVRPSVRRSVRHIFELKVVFALVPLPNRPRRWCRVSGLVHSGVSV